MNTNKVTASLIGIISIVLCLTGFAINSIGLMLIGEAPALLAIAVAVFNNSSK